jgi:hypothetical protein
MLALGAMLLGGAAACEQVASPEFEPAANAVGVASVGDVGGTVVNLQGQPVAGAVVSAHGGIQTTTSASGSFLLAGLPVTARLPVSVSAPGYDGTTAIYEVRSGVLLTRPIRIQPLAPPVVFPAGAGGTVPIAGGGQVVIPAHAFPVSPATPVTVRATYIDPANPVQFSTAPGDFTGRTLTNNIVQIESFGMLSVDVRNPAGQRLDLSPGQQATLQFPASGGTAPGTRPLWRFDASQGIWVEEGQVTVTPTTQNTTVTTLAPRRNVDVRFPPECISVQVLFSNMVTPRANEFVNAVGVSYAGGTGGWTNGSGIVQLPVRASSQVLVQSGTAQQTVTTPTPGTLGCPLVATLAF